MVSVLRNLQAEWNEMVPQAQALGIRRVRTLNLPLESIAYRQGKVEWLRGEIARLTATSSLTPAADLSVLTFGVELEFIIAPDYTRQELASQIDRAGVRCISTVYNHQNGPTWKIVTDSSVDPDYTNGFEIVSPVLRGAEGFRQVQIVCDILKRTGCKVNKKCGLHVHVGAGSWELDTFKNLMRLYKSAESAIDSFIAPSRRESNNDYCKSLNIYHAALDRAQSMDAVAEACGQDPGRNNVRGLGRYAKINLQSYWQHGTVEFRQHQGTIEADKTLNWVKLCLRICLAAQAGEREAGSFDAFFAAVKSPDSEKAFFKGRADFFTAQLNRASNAVSRRLNRLELARQEGTVRSFSQHLPSNDGPFGQAAIELTRRATTRGQE